MSHSPATLAERMSKNACRKILGNSLKPALTRETSIRKSGDTIPYRAGRSFSAPLLPHRCYALRKCHGFRSRGPWPPVGGTDSHAWSLQQVGRGGSESMCKVVDCEAYTLCGRCELGT